MKKIFEDNSFIQLDDDGDYALVSLGGMKGKVLTTLTARIKKEDLLGLLIGIDKNILQPYTNDVPHGEGERK